MAKKSVNRPGRTSPPLRCQFANQVWEAKSAGGGKPKFGITVLLKKDDKDAMAYLKLLHKDLNECLAEGFPNEATRPRTPLVGDNNSPIKDGDKATTRQGIPLKEKYPELVGHYFIRAYSNEFRPPVDRAVQEILNKADLYSGCIVKVNLNAYSFHGDENQGVTLGFNGIQKWADGERLGGGAPAASEMFEAAGADDPENYDTSDPFAGESDPF